MTDQDPTQRYDRLPRAARRTPAPAGAPASRRPPRPAPPGPDAAGRRHDPARRRDLPPAWSGSRPVAGRWGRSCCVVGGRRGRGHDAAHRRLGRPGRPRLGTGRQPRLPELRLDLPGTQQAELAEVMSAFPGFDDQAAFPMKLDEVLDQLVGSATDDEQSYSSDIDPWFGRQLRRVRARPRTPRQERFSCRPSPRSSPTPPRRRRGWTWSPTSRAPPRPPRPTRARRSRSSALQDATPMAPGLRLRGRAGPSSQWATSRPSRPRSTRAARRASTRSRVPDAGRPSAVTACSSRTPMPRASSTAPRRSPGPPRR